jgi:hypothetical protein
MVTVRVVDPRLVMRTYIILRVEGGHRPSCTVTRPMAEPVVENNEPSMLNRSHDMLPDKTSPWPAQ